jgi:hypothetical protein
MGKKERGERFEVKGARNEDKGTKENPSRAGQRRSLTELTESTKATNSGLSHSLAWQRKGEKDFYDYVRPR